MFMLMALFTTVIEFCLRSRNQCS